MGGRVGDTMKTSPAVTCMKLLLMIFNFIFWTSGIAILALGIWTKVELFMYMQLADVYYTHAPWVLIGVGCGIIIIGSLGCCCTVKGRPNLLYIYAVFLVIIFIVDLAVAISAFVYKGKIEDGFEHGLVEAMDKYANDEEMKKTMDNMQQRFKCCGSYNYTDWYKVDWDTTGKGNKVPTSCCMNEEEKCDNTGVEDIFKEGCYTRLSEFTESKFLLIGGVIVAFAFLELFGAMLACCLAKSINKNKYEQVA